MTRLTWHTLERAQRDVALQILRRGPVSRATLADRLALSAGSITRLTSPMIASGLIREGDPVRDGSLGPPRKPLRAEIGEYQFIGVKVTGSELYGVRTNLRGDIAQSTGCVLEATSPDAVCESIAKLVHELSEGPITRIAVGIGGIAREGVVVRAPFLDWSGVPLQELLAAKTGLEVVIENDVIALTDAERWFGLGREQDSFAVVTLGAGIGCGLVIKDSLVHASDAGLGLIGHFPLRDAGGFCFLGHAGCASAALTIPGITGSISAALQRPIDYDETFALVEAGDPAARAVLSASAAGLGQLIAAVTNITGVRHIVLAGEGVRIAASQREAVEAAIMGFRDPLAHPVELTIRTPSFFEWARGAAVIAIQDFTAGGNDAFDSVTR